MQKVRHYFPGGNTSQGFVNFYDQILKKSGTGKLAVIKGGPGTGKSTFMKRIGAKLEASGEMVDYLHCSSDFHSLDGLYLPKYNTAIIDGTAPHIVDARYPASSDIVLNFCDLISETKIKTDSESIKNLNDEISKKFKLTYEYLAAARRISNAMEQRSGDNLDEREITNTAYNISKRLTERMNIGTKKDFFLSAITPLGVKSYIDFAFLDRYVIKLDCQVGDCGYKILEKIISFCQNGNIDMEIYYCPIKPDKPEHIIFPSADTVITTGNIYHSYNNADEVIYYNDFAKNDYDNSKNQVLYDTLIKESVSSLSEAKALHDRLEEFYIKSFDFGSLQPIEERAIEFLTS